MEYEKRPKALASASVSVQHVLLCNRAAASIKLNDSLSALDDCLHAIQLAPNYTIAYNRCGNAYECSGDTTKSLEFHRLAAMLEPSNAGFLENLHAHKYYHEQDCCCLCCVMISHFLSF